MKSLQKIRVSLVLLQFIFNIAIGSLFADFLFVENYARAANYITNPSFTGGITSWTNNALTYDSTYYQDTAGSISGVTEVGRNKALTGDLSQTISTTINSADTVKLSLSWSKQCVSATCTTNDIRIEIEKPSAPGTWVSIWSDTSTPAAGSATSWTGPSAQDVSASFDETGSYNIRVYMDLRNPNNGSAQSLAWIDNINLDIVTPDLTWVTGAADFKIYQSGSLSWGTGTLICSGTLTDDNAGTVPCSSGSLANSTQYRVDMLLKDSGGLSVNMNGAGDYVDHVAVKAGFAGTNPTLGTCAFYDVGTDDGSTTCTAAWNATNDVRITNTGGGNVVIGATTGTEGFMYLITTDSNVPATNATSYLNTSIDGNTEDSSKITITGPSGSLDVTASSTATFTGLSFAFANQNSTNNKIGCVEAEDTRGTRPGWAINITGEDWSDGSDTLDYNGDGSTTGQLSLDIPVIGSVNYAGGGDDLTGFTMGTDDVFDSGTATINLVTVTATNGNGQYWINDLLGSQFVPANQASGAYTLNLIFTAS
jgi:hypothetical protein